MLALFCEVGEKQKERTCPSTQEFRCREAGGNAEGLGIYSLKTICSDIPWRVFIYIFRDHAPPSLKSEVLVKKNPKLGSGECGLQGWVSPKPSSLTTSGELD